MSRRDLDLLIVACCAVLATLSVLLTTPDPVQDVASISQQSDRSAELQELIAKGEIVPGLTLDRAFDLIATRKIRFTSSGMTVEKENIGATGTATILDVDEDMVRSSWGEPNSITESSFGDTTYIYLRPPEGEIHVEFVLDSLCYVYTVPSAEYFKKYHPSWTDLECRRVAARLIVLGFKKEHVIASWGEPKDIHRSVGAWGVHEQWVYGGGRYLYFENDILTSWQD